MPSDQDLESALERVLAGQGTATDLNLLGWAFARKRLTISGDRGVGMGGNNSGSVVTGDGNVVQYINLDGLKLLQDLLSQNFNSGVAPPSPGGGYPPAPISWAPGETLQNGRYKILWQIGQGGFGLTYLAEDTVLRRQVVIKIPNQTIQTDPDYDHSRRRFELEGQTLAQVRHPNIVQVLDLCQERGVTCLVMAYVSGETLKEVIRRRGAMAESEATRIFQKLAAALHQLHQTHQIIHCDVQPNNIILQPDGEPVLIDFGSVKLLQPSPYTFTTTVNQHFAPYEQGQLDQSPEPSWDIYALAATFYFVVTGKKPEPALSRKLSSKILRPPDSYNPQLSNGVNRAILWGMALEAADRPASMQAWQAHLQPPTPKLSPNARPSITNPTPPGPPQLAATPKLSRRWLLAGGLFAGSALILPRFFPDSSPDSNPDDVGTQLPSFSSPDNSLTPEPSPDSPTPEPSPDSASPSSLQTHRYEVVSVDDRGQVTQTDQGQANRWDVDLGGGVKLQLLQIPSGSFTMGSPGSEAGRRDAEGPQRRVTVPSFFMGRFPVTQGQWRAVAGMAKVERDLDPDPARFKGSDDLPVETVSWNDAVEFCQRLSRHTGRDYRLPSEAEWEYACRAGTTTPFHFGPTITPELVNYDGNHPYGQAAKGQYRQKTTPVGSFPANGFGLHDMHGNVWEWCADVWHDNYNGAPTDGSAWNTGGDGNLRVLRGGSWYNNAVNCRSAVRNRYQPDNRNYYDGFRDAVVSPVAQTP